jgi:signal transduction histidine kinase
VLASDDPLVAWCRASRRPCVRAELAWTVEGRAPSAVPDADPDRRALDTLDRLDADVACLLIREDDLLGLLALGPKRSELPYRAGEVAFIGALAAQAAVTLQAIRLHEAARALEKDLHEADKFASLGAVASEIAHEIRNPLSVVKTYVQLLPQKQGDPRFLGRFQERVVPEITRVEGILSNLLDGASGRRTAFASVSLAEVAAATLDFFEEDLARRRIAAVRDWNGAAPALNGDAGQLRQVFQNLILNAIQAMPQGGRLRVGVRADGGVLRVEVADTGPGIPPDQLPLLFRPFATTKPAGTGLGLAISRRIVGEHGGTLQVESRAGEGSVFVIEFPVDGRGDGAGAQPDAPLRGERTPGA